MKSTLALFSSARRHGNTGRLMDRIADELGLAVVDLGEKILLPTRTITFIEGMILSP